MEDRIPLIMSQNILEYLRNKKRMGWKRIANLAGASESSIQRIRKGEVGFFFQQLLNLVERVGIDVISIPKDASPEIKELYEAYREVLK